MGENSKISWTDHTFNPWMGCTKVSPGCTNCYAERIGARLLGVQWGDFPRKVTTVVNWNKVHAWNRRAARTGVRERVFCGSLCDVFENRPELDQYRLELGRLIKATPNLDWLLVTKRPESIRLGIDRAPPNVWLIASVEDQIRLDQRAPELLRVPAAVHGLSCEPLLGPLDLQRWLRKDGLPIELGVDEPFSRGIDWVIVGCESGPRARPCEIGWVRSIVSQCKDAGVPVFVKQIQIDGRLSRDPSEWPDDLRVQEWPEVRS